MNPRLVRVQEGAVLGGVCIGLARYLNVDPLFPRLIFIALAFGPGIGVIIYLILWVALPREGQAGGQSFEQSVRAGAEEVAARAQAMGQEFAAGVRASSDGENTGQNQRAAMWIGTALIVAGAVFLAQTLDVSWLRWLSFDLLWPLLLVAAGIGLIVRRSGGGVK